MSDVNSISGSNGLQIKPIATGLSINPSSRPAEPEPDPAAEESPVNATEVSVSATVDSKDDDEATEPLDKAVAKLEGYVQSVNRDLLFKVDNLSGDVVVTVMDSISKDIIRQIPGEAAIALSKTIDEMGLNLFDDSV